ncbi:uncharacterized protein CC84DRAFT_1087925 [Paraphaeosphaeria sporulosa]|uniref:Putative lipoate-protein ligase A n=1 Tax=Paraphaeosphaeria sporulosa TaxID=1460663 RepID=A0A177CJ39_9PLEO|nr:uncharacterized protein CC84DRAFT_1087925 [Paraphaeosphaeria sporulosa]OAG07535.1 hypothetical protein CC84DRAFT_1087925 [Paraphaeosphaeria sporulosa]
MAPSRGLARLLPRPAISNTGTYSRTMSFARRAYSSFAEQLANPANRVQSYISRSRDPFVNLSIEDYILRASPPDSTVLFLYTNRPCVVIGRNQNPWSEVNLGILQAATSRGTTAKETEPPAIGDVHLVRRRSGGGAVFHDEGNLNWSITCPRTEFTRDKHAEMVVRALRKIGIERARVNERHDIVLDQGHERHPSDPQDTHRTSYTVDEGGPRPLKVSGSAYKLTRGRALHHATTLLASPNLHVIPQYLHSPARKSIQAKGVESVSSPVANIGLDVEMFQKRLQEEFSGMYAHQGTTTTVQTVGEEHLKIPEIRKGYNELKTDDWMWSQTPQFNIAFEGPARSEIDINVHHGIIKTLETKGGSFPDDMLHELQTALVGQKLQDIGDWSQCLQSRIEPWHSDYGIIADRLETLLPVPQFERP